ncbi:MAG: GNAT family N-acetyltransferase [Elusimicrobiota bacterium]|jgi:RimJ/RimL family protein N-acetyltransferase
MSRRPRRAEPRPLPLRPATLADGAALLLWRNDPTAYRFFFHARPVASAEHADWLRARLLDPRTRLFMLLDPKRRPLGQIRLDLGRRGLAEVSLSLAPEARGRGLGPRAIAGATARARRLGIRRLLAHTRADNLPSTLAFLKAGYQFVRRLRRGGYDYYRLERAP